MGFAAVFVMSLIPLAAAACGPRHAHRPGRSAKPATIGADMHAAPRGTTIPAAGLGVDLVRGGERNAPTDPAARRANGVPDD